MTLFSYFHTSADSLYVYNQETLWLLRKLALNFTATTARQMANCHHNVMAVSQTENKH